MHVHMTRGRHFLRARAQFTYGDCMDAKTLVRPRGRASVVLMPPPKVVEVETDLPMPELRRLMVENGFARQMDLARASGVSQSALSRWINGETMLSLENMRRVAPCLNVRPGDLMVMSGATPEELGMVTEPLAPEVNDINKRLMGKDLNAKEKRALRHYLAGAMENYDVLVAAAREAQKR